MGKVSDKLPDSFAALIGRVADKWSQFEFHIDMGIWQLACVEQQLGACITAQLLSIHPRFKAFIALAEIRGAKEGTHRKLSKFYSETASGLSDRRNRCLHDPRMIDKKTSGVHRLEITAKPKLHFGFKPESTEDVKKLVSEIDAAVREFISIRNALFEELNALSPESQPKLSRITLVLDHS
ncbi:MAG: hypothetical protein EXQ88_00990 [Alphaproteobacteria bacterium]|nr:hypothetical protein [Alphaproteobacteria bacterium]